MARSRRAGNRPTIRRMLETVPARVAAPVTRPAVDEPIPDESIGWEPLGLPRAIRSRRTYRIPVVVLTTSRDDEDIVRCRAEYVRLAETLWRGTDPLAPAPLPDRDIFELLGFD